MRQLLRTIGLFLIFECSALAQNNDPIPAPPEVVLEFGIDGSGLQFHLGELIPIQYSYRASPAGRYFRVGGGTKLIGGQSFQISCFPPPDHLPDPQTTDDLAFRKMLYTCGGVGAGSGSGCGECGGDDALTEQPLNFSGIALNRYVRFRTPGTYTCEASSAEITSTSRDEKTRQALLVKSKPVTLKIVDDPAWSHSTAIALANSFDKLCRGDVAPEKRTPECFAVAQRITYLDTLDSLASEVKFFDNRNHGWETGFWDAIQRSSYPEDAVQRMTARLQEPDFEVSNDVVEWLAVSTLKNESPNAFQASAMESWHRKAVDTLRIYARLIGKSLAHKDPKVLPESLKTYRRLAEEEYCDTQPLIPLDELNQALSNLATER